MLIDSMPDAMAELMRIATIGRSLGLHLVLATQRPQSAISGIFAPNVAHEHLPARGERSGFPITCWSMSLRRIFRRARVPRYVRPAGWSFPAVPRPLVDAVPLEQHAVQLQVLGS